MVESVAPASAGTLSGFQPGGKAKDEALRIAQLDLIRSKKSELSHPYNWAGFSLYGDWR